jgi:hypothetical protein
MYYKWDSFEDKKFYYPNLAFVKPLAFSVNLLKYVQSTLWQVTLVLFINVMFYLTGRGDKSFTLLKKRKPSA